MNDLDRPTTDLLQWRIADTGFWVGTRASGFAGTVDQNGPHFYVRNHFGEYLGDYPTLVRAQKALAAHLAETAHVHSSLTESRRAESAPAGSGRTASPRTASPRTASPRPALRSVA